MAVIMPQKRLELRRWRNIWRTNSNFRGHSLITRADCDPLKRWSVEGRQVIEVWVQDFGSTPHPDPRHELARSSNRSLPWESGAEDARSPNADASSADSAGSAKRLECVRFLNSTWARGLTGFTRDNKRIEHQVAQRAGVEEKVD